MKIFNTLTRSLEEFIPLDPARKRVGIYVCGPTVYDNPHIGHARSAYIFDVLRRYLRSKGFTVTFVRNVTDVDDKIINKAKEELATSDKRQVTSDLKAKCREVAQRYLASYHAAMDRLGIERPDVEPLATERVVPDMTDLIAKLLMQGAAYEAKGDVYFSVRKSPGYGKLSNRTLDELQAGVRVEPGEHKQDPLDCALWKAAKPDEPSWESPWGRGRPGWHIECSAMSTKELGDTFDLHGGGVDLVFPHHENEIAQAQAAGKPFARYWVHNGLLTVNGEKMSKSLGNFITVDQALNECVGEADVLKVFFLGTHYRSPIDYSPTNLDGAVQRFDGLWAFLDRVKKWGRPPASATPTPKELAELEQEFIDVMDEDLNTPRALAVLDQLAGLGYQWTEEWMHSVTLEEKTGLSQEPHLRTAQAHATSDSIRTKFVQAADMIRKFGQILGLFSELFEVTPEIQTLVEERERARERKDFARADAIRKELAAKGVLLEDTIRGTIVRRKR